MVDLETLSVTPRSVVLTLGAVHFDPWGSGYGNTLYLKFDLDDQDRLGREIDPGTIDWWAKQNNEIMEQAFDPNGRIKVADAMDKFHKFAWGCSNFWSHGASFDLVILEDIYRQLNKPLPWNFWQMRCTRTLFDLGQDPEMPQNAKHNALEDAIRQCIGVQNVYKKLKIKGK